NFWEIEAIPENSIPEPLLIELIGSRKDILFCEGIRGGLDEFIFNILFPNYTVTSVQSCFNVINYTKVFNITPNMQIKAIGFIDSDHHPDSRLSALTRESIYSFQVAEIENLLLDENFLSLLAEKILSDDTSLIQIIKEEAFKLFEKDIELQVANYISSKIDYYFKDSNMNKGNSLPEVKSNYNLFLNTIDIEKWYNDRKKELIEISSTRDYNKLLKVYNNKGLKSIAEKNFKISNFTDRALKLLQISNDAQSHIKKYFPSI
ncbi:MAG TPA: DUF4435 domain-containing protein, partial [Flavobacterium sp.]|nr:DUF4435 domain-containing protein [Flavobacterium sp.]